MDTDHYRNFVFNGGDHEMNLAVTLNANDDEEFAEFQELLDELDSNMEDRPSISQVNHLCKALEAYLNLLSKEDLA